MTRSRLLGIMLLVLAVPGLRAQPTYAAAQQVGDCTFATLQADLQLGGDWYYAAGQCSSPITFTGTVSIGQNAGLTAQGNDITLQGGNAGGSYYTYQLFNVSSGVSFGLTGLTLTGSHSAGDGGPIYNNGSLTITNSTLSGNSAGGDGGAILNNGTVTITASTLSGNSAGNDAGGAILNNGTVTITASTLSGNTAYDGRGGAILNNGGTVTITASTLSGNSAPYGGSGGAVESDSGTVTITASTLSGNSAQYGGAVDNSGTVTITASTLSGNSAYVGGAIDNEGATVQVGGSIIAKSPSGGNCDNPYGGTFTDLGYNLEDDAGASCGFSSGNHDLVGSDPQFVLDSSNGNPLLADNGGPTQTIALQQGSPAIDRIPTSYDLPGTTTPLCSSTDQRGDTRPDDGEANCDIGAYEYSGPDRSPTTLTAVSGSGTYAGTATLTATLTSASTAVSGETVSFSLNGNPVCGGSTGVTCPTTNSSGVAMLNNVSLAGIAAGTHSGAVGASFAGESAYSSSTGSGALTVAPATQTITFGALSNHTYGDAPFTVSATATSGLPVSFSVGSTDQCTIAGNTVTITGAGSCTVTASQSGNGNYTAAPSVSQTFSIAKAASTTGLTSSATPSVFGQTVTFTAKVSPATATGTIQFQVDGANSSSPVSLSGGSASLTTSALAVGSHTVSAVYSGDGNFIGSSASALTQTVNQAATTTSLASSVTPSLVKQSVTFTATVAAVAPGSGTPGGTVTFKDGTTTLGTGTLNSSGIATFTTTSLAAGTHSITASYGGNTSFTASTSSAVSQQVRYTVKVLSTSSLTVVVQLLDANNANVSASNLTVTAECVVPYSATAPTSCGSTPVQTITKAFGFVSTYKGLGAAYSFSINPHGLTRGQQYYLLVQADGDPIWHAVPFTD